MTVCISAICRRVGDPIESLIMVSDQMISMGGYTGGDKAAVKIDPLYYRWFSQFSANDVSAILPVYKIIENKNREKDTLTSVTDIAGLCKAAYKAGRLERIQDEVLAEYGITWKELKEHGSSRLDVRDLQLLTERIRSFDLALEMLVGGFDEDNEAHIFTVGNPGTANFYDKLGFWAIGSGQPNAMASLFSSGFKPSLPLEECVAHVLSAKFSAESAQGVGKSTFLVVYNGRDEMLSLPDSLEGKVKKEWQQLPRIPRKNLSKIGEALEQSKISADVTQSDSQKSEGQP